MQVRPHLLLAISLAALGSPGLGQTFGSDPANGVGIPNLTTFPFEGGAKGDFTGDGLLDAILVNEGKPYLVYGPSIFRWAGATPYQVSDLDVVPGIGAKGEDALLYTDATGVHRALYVDESQWQSTNLGYPIFSNARRLRVGDIDADGELDMVAISGTENALLVVTGIEDNVHAAQPIIALPEGTLYDLALMDWSGGSQLEIVVAHSLGILVYSNTGSPLAMISMTYRNCQLFPIEENGTQRLLTIFETMAGGGISHLKVLGNGITETDFEAGPESITAADVADVNGDGRDDVIVMHENDFTPTLYLNQTSTPTFTSSPSSASELIDYLNGALPDVTNGNKSTPLLADFDNDGDPDLFFADDQASAYYFENLTLDADDKKIQIDDAVEITWKWNTDAFLEAVPLAGTPTVPLGDLDELQILVYFKGSNSATVDPDPIANTYDDISTGLPTELIFPVDYVYLSALVVDWEGTYYIYYRALRRNASGAVVGAYPFKSLAFQPYNSPGFFELGVTQQLEGAPFEPIERIGVGPGVTPDPEPPVYGDPPPSTDPP